MSTFDKLFLTVISLLIVIVILVTANSFLMQDDYEFFVEAPCDPAETTCFVRGCSGDECPSNGLEQYRIFSVRADEFRSCADNSCLRECEEGAISCSEITCGETEGDECAYGPDTATP